ncbi:MAG: hypothetical protein LC104_09875 [Bacteroidales bacterium]|nr:hypothetical protein [Bacteroidales bacterium]
MTCDLNVIALIKGTERFIFVYDDASRDEVISTVYNHAADPARKLNWSDAAILTERVRQQVAEQPDTAAESIPNRIPTDGGAFP